MERFGREPESIIWQRNSLLNPVDYHVQRTFHVGYVQTGQLPSFHISVSEDPYAQSVVLAELQRYSGLPHSIDTELDAQITHKTVAEALQSYTMQTYRRVDATTFAPLSDERRLVERCLDAYRNLSDLIPVGTLQAIGEQLVSTGLYRPAALDRVLAGEYLPRHSSRRRAMLTAAGMLVNRVNFNGCYDFSEVTRMSDQISSRVNSGRFSADEYQKMREILTEGIASVAAEHMRNGQPHKAGEILTHILHTAESYPGTDADMLRKATATKAARFMHTYSGPDGMYVDIRAGRTGRMLDMFESEEAELTGHPVVTTAQTVGFSVRTYADGLTETNLRHRVANLLRTDDPDLLSV
ncbi:MAG: hypothetical protein TR69_WS6001000982 [candidate division WS6 bacterium OLB20]|uniref:Uncharacterized protein n=1 Tax=candidate division WS6 bacterium OLB20 TaxID=1617426 RepID=A0A136LZ74_9BACT|nr:MAG: hypothetical protein TR69_WS6001000982 [candidate division WS6 bacterium OLB20]